MKLPFDLGVKLVFRILVPGFFLMLAVRPILLSLLERSGGSSYNDLALTVAILILGWFITILDMPVYMLFEGRRFWPEWLLAYGVRREEARLRRWLGAERWNYDQFKEHQNVRHQRRYQEASVEVRRFPLDESTGAYTAIFPTRLGNLITAYEQYPLTRYGADAIFYLPRVWLKLDKDLREELDTHQAVADSALYSSLALFVTGVFWFAYAAIPRRYAPWLQYTATPALALAAGIAAVAMSAILYRAAIHVNDQYGAVFRAMFDVYLPAITKDLLAGGPVLRHVAHVTRDTTVLTAPVRDQFRIVWRYLQNYRVRCNRCGVVMAPEDAMEHRCT